MEKLYSSAVVEMTERGEAASSVAQKLKAHLEKTGRLSLLSKIAQELERTRQRSTAESTLSVAKESDTTRARKASAEVSDKGARVVIDEHLVGGWRLQTPNTLIDATHKRHLLDLYRQITQ